MVPSFLAIVLLGGVVYWIAHYRQLIERSHRLEQQIQTHQQQIEQTWIEIHNGLLQVLAFLMREVQTHNLAQQELLQHLHTVYREIQSGVQRLQDPSSSR
ncbi:hypothetical protein Q2T42_18850 [Leptolyngbya boryana CZ1]|uniref:Uncharacterized protein n=1 Tax=Leptolyngbya boryana CZ1 TaxID=3060204 RepID=A0AA97ALB8_LEPBY|nr:hypothetical protein [Leptolyngbya boryana]WNZ43898.1 hypothetical protein Q2T42_18850 [Leptolyngbya boryana CZ1]